MCPIRFIESPLTLDLKKMPTARFIFFGYNRYEAAEARKWASLLPATAFAFGADIVADYEYAEQGIQPWNASEGEYSFNTAVGFLFFDTFLYLFLGWYFEQIMPREYGVPKPFWFLLSPKYWCGCFFPGSTKSQPEALVGGTDSSDVEHSADQNEANEEVTDLALVPTVVMENLVKKYSKKADAAVDHLNLTLYESQITTLLGHNGKCVVDCDCIKIILFTWHASKHLFSVHQVLERRLPFRS